MIPIDLPELGRRGRTVGQPLEFQVREAAALPCRTCAKRPGCQVACPRFIER